MCNEVRTFYKGIPICDIGMCGDFDVSVLDKNDYKYCDFKNTHDVYNYECAEFLKYNNTDIVLLEDENLYVASLSAKRMKKYNIQDLSINDDNIIVTIARKNNVTDNFKLSLNNMFKVALDNNNEVILKHLSLV